MAVRAHRRFSQVVAGSAADPRVMDRGQDKSREVRARSERIKDRNFKILARGAQVVASLRFRASGCLASGNPTSRRRRRP
jgi:hypothetical protein